MHKRFGLGLALVTSLSLGACGDDVDESISGVVPGDVFAGRTANVLISGNNTSWGEGVSVSFGDGITAGDVIVASPTALWVPITVTSDAALGARDVTVDSLSFDGAFSVISPLKISSLQGTLAQGSITTVRVQSLDFTTPFDTSDGNMEVVLRDGLTAQPGFAEPYSFSFTILADVDAEPGAVDVEVLSGPPAGEPLSFKQPAGLELLPRTAEIVAVGDIAGSFEVGGDSLLFKIEPATLTIIDALALSDSPDAAIQFIVMTESGHFDEIVAVGAPSFFDPSARASFLAADPLYVVVSDLSGIGGYDFSLGVSSAEIGDATVAEAGGDNNTFGNAQAVTLPVAVTASLADDEDEDWYEVVIAGGDVGKSLGIATFAPQNTDTVIDVFEDDGTTSILGDEVDLSFHEVVFTPPLTAGTYFVRILNTHAFPDFPPTPGPYSLALGLSAE